MHQPVLHQDALHRPWPCRGCEPAANHAKYSAVVLLIQMHRRQFILTMHHRTAALFVTPDPRDVDASSRMK
eukprot:4737294-Prymnesium_polylepis.1